MAKKISKKSVKKATPKAAKKTDKRKSCAVPQKKSLSKKLDQLRKKFLQTKADLNLTGKRMDAKSDTAVTATKSAKSSKRRCPASVCWVGLPLPKATHPRKQQVKVRDWTRYERSMAVHHRLLAPAIRCLSLATPKS